jgi:hypothetical protein
MKPLPPTAELLNVARRVVWFKEPATRGDAINRRGVYQGSGTGSRGLGSSPLDHLREQAHEMRRFVLLPPVQGGQSVQGFF